MKKSRYSGDRRAQYMLAAGVAMTPNCSVNAAETIISCIRKATFLQYNIEATEKEVSNSSPSCTTINKALANLATSCLNQLSQPVISTSCLNQRLKEIEEANAMYGTYDKGH